MLPRCLLHVCIDRFRTCSSQSVFVIHHIPECRIAVFGPHDAEYMSELKHLPPEAKVRPQGAWTGAIDQSTLID